MRTIVFCILFILTGVCLAQTPSIERTKKSFGFIIGNKVVNNLFYTVTNKTESTYYIWLSKDKSSLSDSLKIRKHFRIPLPKSDGSLYQLMLDGNVGSFIYDIFNGFVKVLRAGESFTFIFTEEYECSEQIVNSMSNIVDRREEENTPKRMEQAMTIIMDTMLNITSEYEMNKQCQGIDASIMLYGNNYISIPWHLLLGRFNF